MLRKYEIGCLIYNSGSTEAKLHFIKDGQGKNKQIFGGKTGHEYQ